MSTPCRRPVKGQRERRLRMNVKDARRLRELKRIYETVLALDFDPPISMAIDRCVVAIERRE